MLSLWRRVKSLTPARNRIKIPVPPLHYRQKLVLAPCWNNRPLLSQWYKIHKNRNVDIERHCQPLVFYKHKCWGFYPKGRWGIRETRFEFIRVTRFHAVIFVRKEFTQWLGSGGQSPLSHYRSPSSIPVLVHMIFVVDNWQWDGRHSQYFGFPLSSSFHHCSILNLSSITDPIRHNIVVKQQTSKSTVQNRKLQSNR